MIKSFYDAGQLLSQLDDYKDYFRPWANPFPKIRGEAKVIVAEINDSQLEPDLKVEDFKTALVDKYLFREAKANATNLVPTFYVQAQAEAEKRLGDTISTLQVQADRARRYGVLLAFLTAASFLVSAVAAWWGGVTGGKHRDDEVDHSRHTAWK